MAGWIIDDSIIKLSVPGGDKIIPNAQEIYGAEFSNQKIIQGHRIENPPSKSIAGLLISRYPLELIIKINRGAAETLQPLLLCEVYGRYRERELPIPDFFNQKADHILTENSWYPFPQGSISEIHNVLENCGIYSTGPISLGQYLNLIRYENDIIQIIDCSENAAKASHVHSEHITPPALFNGLMYPYQLSGYRWLTIIADEKLGCILSDEMGLGKTIQIIALLADHKTDGRGSSLIVVPATLLENWKREIIKFAPSLATTVHRGAERTAFAADLKKYDIVISSYDTIIRDLPLMEMISWNILVLDEAQAIKNPKAKRSRCVKTLNRGVSIAVTGTPVENSLTDLWSIMDFSLPGFLGPLDEFESKYLSVNPKEAESLEPQISPLILRRTVNEVAKDLPERIEIPQALSMSHEMAKNYEQVRIDTIEKYGVQGNLVALINLRMFCAHPFLITEDRGDLAEASTKYYRLIEIISELASSGEKALIFTSFNKMADNIESDVASRLGIYTDFIDGRVPVVERQGKIDTFSSHKGPAILVLNPRAAGTGLNITSANHVIHYNLEWNPAVEDQASARAYRLGQTRPVTIHRLFFIDTVEEVIDQRLDLKRDLAEAVIVGTDGHTDQEDMIRALQISPAGRRLNE